MHGCGFSFQGNYGIQRSGTKKSGKEYRINRQCAISGERTLPVLEAAHIKPYTQSGPHATANGLLLRSDLHKLFDTGYLTITQDHRVEVSGRIREEFENGREYYRFRGSKLLILIWGGSIDPLGSGKSNGMGDGLKG